MKIKKPRQYTYDEWIEKHPEIFKEEDLDPKKIYQELCQKELTRWKNWRKELKNK